MELHFQTHFLGTFLVSLSCLFVPVQFYKLSGGNPSSSSSSSVSVVSKSVSDILTGLYSDCKLFLIYANFTHGRRSRSSDLHWGGGGIYGGIASSKGVISDSAGLTNIFLNEDKVSLSSVPAASNPFLPKFTLRPFRTLEAKRYCHVVILMLPEGLHAETEALLHSKLNLPLLNPLTSRNEDKFLILSGVGGKSSLYESKLIRELKYKLFLIINEATSLPEPHFKTYCPHCPIKEKDVELTNPPEYFFPDFQKSFHSSKLKVSATDKLPGLLEIGTNPETGINYPKRGVYASALLHLAHGLNFTWKLYRSSGGGSTGHPLPNNTWVGTVGDVINGKVDFGLVCGMTFIRHPVIELCSTITFEYISFAVGPSPRIYTWKAIFWPFDALFWLGMVGSSFLVIFVSHFLLKYTSSWSDGMDTKWTVWTVAAYLPKTFLEQAEDIPVGLAQSLKVILGYWLLFSMIGATLYRAKMVGFMTFPVLEKAPDTFDELARSSKWGIQFHYFGNVAYNTFKTSTSPTYMTIFQKMLKQPDPLECLKSTLKEGAPSSCILFGCVYEELKNRNLSDKFGQSPIRISPNYGFMYTPGVLHEKKAAFSSNFKWILQNSMQMGLNQQWERSDLNNLLKMRNHWLRHLSPGERKRSSFQYEFQGEGEEDVLHLKHFKGAFTVLFGGVLCAGAAFFWEKWGRKWREDGGKRIFCCRKKKHGKLEEGLGQLEKIELQQQRHRHHHQQSNSFVSSDMLQLHISQ